MSGAAVEKMAWRVSLQSADRVPGWTHPAADEEKIKEYFPVAKVVPAVLG